MLYPFKVIFPVSVDDYRRIDRNIIIKPVDADVLHSDAAVRHRKSMEASFTRFVFG